MHKWPGAGQLLERKAFAGNVWPFGAPIAGRLMGEAAMRINGNAMDRRRPKTKPDRLLVNSFNDQVDAV